MDLKEAYFSVEDKYYEFCDWAEDKGAPIYKYFVDPIENRGVPSFPFFILLAALVLGGLAFAVLSLTAPQTTSINIAVYSGEAPLEGIPVTLLIQGESEERTAVSGADGIAAFKGVPVGKTGTVKILKEGYESFAQQVSVRPDMTFSASLQAAQPQKQKVQLQVADESGAGVPGATIYFEDQTVQTGADGKAFVEIDPTQGTYALAIEKDGYVTKNDLLSATVKQKIIKLTAKKDEQIPIGNQEDKGSISVFVKGEEGEPVEARVTLYNAELGAPLIDGDRTNEHGSVYWGDQVAVGTIVYIAVEPLDSDTYAPYDGINDPQEISDVGETEFHVTLLRKEPAAFGKLTLTTVDDAGVPLEGVEFRIFLQGSATQAPVDNAQTTETSGRAVFEVATGASFYATAYLDGYLPAILRDGLRAGDDKQLRLSRAILGNNGDAEITVLDADGTPVPGAMVEMLYADGFNSGIPVTSADSNGIATFAALPLSEVFSANAVAGSASGRSDPFSAALGEVVQATVSLEPTYGNIVVLAADATNGAPISAVSASAAYRSGEEAATCTATVAGTCQLKVRSNKEVAVTVNSAGYATQESETLSVSTGEALSKTFNLLPAALANNLTVLDFHLEDDNGVTVPTNQVSKGSYYWVKFTANLPTSDLSGMFVSVGNAAIVDDDVASVSYIQTPSNLTSGPSALLNPAVTYASAFNPGPNCANDLAIQKDTWKWVNFQYSNYSGAPTMSLRIFVKPTATNKDKLVIKYRAYAKKGRVWARAPKDADLGDKEKISYKDSCYAEANAKEYNIVDGTSSCDRNACLGLSFALASDPTVRTGAGFTTDVNSSILVFFEVRPFVALTSPYIELTSPEKEVLFTAYDVGGGAAVVPEGLTFADNDLTALFLQSFTTGRIAIGLAAGQTLNGNASALAVFQTSFSKIRLELGDARGAIKIVEVPISIQGTGTLNVSVDPATIFVGQDQKITVFVSTITATGTVVPIQDAKVTLLDGDGNPMNGQTYRGSPIVGDATKNNGLDGYYVFSKVSPVYNGTMLVQVERKGFATLQVPVAVNAENFLVFEPDEVTGLQFSEDNCNKSVTLKVTNPLDTQIPIRITIPTSGGKACAKITGPSGLLCARDTCTLTLPRKKTIALSVKVNDKFAQTCDLVFNTRLNPAGGVTATHTVPTTIDCRAGVPAGTVPCSTYADCPARADCVCLDPNQGALRVGGRALGGIGKPYPIGGRGEPGSGTRDVNGVQIPYVAGEGDEIPTADCGPAGCECLTPEGEAAGYCDCITGFENYYIERFGELWTYYEWASRAGDLWRIFTGDKSGKTETMADSRTGVILEGPELKFNSTYGSSGSPLKLTISPLLPYDAFALSFVVRKGQAGYDLRSDGNNCLLVREFQNPKKKATIEGTVSLSGQISVKSYYIVFNPECLDTEIKDGKFSIRFSDKPADSKHNYAITVAAGTKSQTVNVEVSIVPDSKSSDFAFLFVPSAWGKGKVVARGASGADYVEPFYYLNNIQDPFGLLANNAKFKVTAREDSGLKDILPGTTPQLGYYHDKIDSATDSNITYTSAQSKPEVTSAEAKLSEKVIASTEAAVKELLKYDVIGNIETGPVCDDTGFCIDFEKYFSDFKAKVQKEFSDQQLSRSANKIQVGTRENLFTVIEGWAGIKLLMREAARTYLTMGNALVDTAKEMCCNPEAAACMFGALPTGGGAPPTFTNVPIATAVPQQAMYPQGFQGPYTYAGAAGGVGAVTPVTSIQCIQYAMNSLCSMGQPGQYRAGRSLSQRMGRLDQAGYYYGSGGVAAGRRKGFCGLLTNGFIALLANQGFRFECQAVWDYEIITNAFANPNVNPVFSFLRDETFLGESTSKESIIKYSPAVYAVDKKAGENGGMNTITCTGSDCEENVKTTGNFLFWPIGNRGYPYLDCAGSCSIGWDQGAPVLATLNKYAYAAENDAALGIAGLIATARGAQPKVSGGAEIKVNSCNMSVQCKAGLESDYSSATTDQARENAFAAVTFAKAVTLRPDNFVFKCDVVPQAGSDADSCALVSAEGSKLYSNKEATACMALMEELKKLAASIAGNASAIAALDDARFGVEARAVGLKAEILGDLLKTVKIDNCVAMKDANSPAVKAIAELRAAIYAAATEGESGLYPAWDKARAEWYGKFNDALQRLSVADCDYELFNREKTLLQERLAELPGETAKNTARKTELESDLGPIAAAKAELAIAESKYRNILSQITTLNSEIFSLYISSPTFGGGTFVGIGGFDTRAMSITSKERMLQSFEADKIRAMATVTEKNKTVVTLQAELESLKLWLSAPEAERTKILTTRLAALEPQINDAAERQNKALGDLKFYAEPKGEAEMANISCAFLGTGCGKRSVLAVTADFAKSGGDKISDLAEITIDGKAVLSLDGQKLRAASLNGAKVAASDDKVTVTATGPAADNATSMFSELLKYFYDESYDLSGAAAFGGMAVTVSNSEVRMLTAATAALEASAAATAGGLHANCTAAGSTCQTGLTCTQLSSGSKKVCVKLKDVILGGACFALSGTSSECKVGSCKCPANKANCAADDSARTCQN